MIGIEVKGINYLNFNNINSPLKGEITNLFINRTPYTCNQFALKLYLGGHINTLKTVRNNLQEWFESIADSKALSKKPKHIYMTIVIITVSTHDLLTIIVVFIHYFILFSDQRY